MVEDEIIPEDEINAMPEKNQIPKKPKPSIEGINTPMVTNRVVPLGQEGGAETAEKSDESKMLLPSMMQKSHGVRNFLLTALILVILGFGGYYGYEEYFLKTEKSSELGLQLTPPETGTQQDSLGNDVQPQPTPTPSGPAVATSTPAEPVLVNKSIVVGSTPTGYLNVRGQPATSGKLITQIKPGEIYAYTEIKNDWYHIVLNNGQTGWVIGTYVTKQ